jgi:hypothetical protein
MASFRDHLVQTRGQEPRQRAGRYPAHGALIGVIGRRSKPETVLRQHRSSRHFLKASSKSKSTNPARDPGPIPPVAPSSAWPAIAPKPQRADVVL